MNQKAAILVVVLVFVFACLSAGCGQKGDLYRADNADVTEESES